jgi:hypothetical protein
MMNTDAECTKQLRKMELKKVIGSLFRKDIKVRIHVDPTVPKYDDDYVMIDAKGNSCS